MSYLPRRIRGRATPYSFHHGAGGGSHVFHIKPRPASMGSALTDALGIPSSPSAGAPNAACDAAGRAAQAPYDAQLAQITAQWKQRDDFYYVTDMDAIVKQGFQFMNAAQSLIDQINSTYGEYGKDDLKSARSRAQSDIFDVGRNSLDFVTAMNKAKLAGAAIVDAPGLRNWIVDAIVAAGGAAYLAAYTQCAMPSGSSAILFAAAKLTGAGRAFVALLSAIATVVVKTGEVVYTTTVGTLGLIATAVRYAPLIGGAFLAAWLWKKHKRGG
jgi:hypothetical protein